MSGECIIYRPLTIDESVIVSGPPDAEAQVYDAGTTYATGDEVWYAGNAWRSKVDSNTGNTPVDGANWDDLGEVDRGADAWTAGNYAEGVWKVRNHRLYQSAKSSNTDTPGEAPLTSWTDWGPTNRYLAFDENLARFSTSKGSLKWVFEFPDNAVHCTVFSPVGSIVSLSKVADASTIYDEELNLLLDGDVDYWGYFFIEPRRRFNALFDDMVSVPGERITFEISSDDADATVAVSGLHFGFGLQIGPVVTGGTGLETKGFVSIQFDEFGNRISPIRPKQQITRFATRPDIRETSRLSNEMNTFSQLPCVAFMRDGEDFGLLAWGILDDHTFDMPNSVIAELAVKIKGFPQ